MRVKISISIQRELEVDHPIFQQLADIHRKGPASVANDIMYDIATKEIERVTGISTDYNESISITSVDALPDKTPILEF